jgi:hypothetical protein
MDDGISLSARAADAYHAVEDHREDAMRSLAPFMLIVASFASSANAGTRNIILAQAAPPEVCTQVYQPVCGTDPGGKRVTYSNACFARVAKATNVTPGECK